MWNEFPNIVRNGKPSQAPSDEPLPIPDGDEQLPFERDQEESLHLPARLASLLPPPTL
jgi:hypothetical protein